VELEIDAGVKFATNADLAAGLDGVVEKLKPRDVRFSPVPVFGSGSSANSASTPFVIDLGEPPSGRVWEIVSITICGADDNTVVSGKVGLYTGKLPAPGEQPNLLSGLRIPLMTIPFWDDIGGRRLWCQPGERMFVNVSGVANGTLVNVRVDTAEWRQAEIMMHSGR